MAKSDLYKSKTIDRSAIRIDVFGQMLKGSVIAGSVFFGPILFIVALAYAGTLLPQESKEAVDPTPDSFGATE